MKFSLIFFLIALAPIAKAQGINENSRASNHEGRGFEIVQSREGQCTLCHSIPNYKGVMGNLGPSLEGVGKRLNEAQLRARLIDSRKINPTTIMPPYFSTEGLSLVDPKLSGKTILSASELEDVLAYLKSLL
jgi:sulfur-oxidizing protein SoxX